MTYNLLQDAVVKNLSRCYWDSNIGYNAQWITNGDTLGWSAAVGIVCNNAWSGVYFGTISSLPNYFYTPTGITYFNAMSFDNITIKMKAIRALGPDDYLRFSWLTTNDTVWDTLKSIDIPVTADSSWQTYTFSLAGVQKWSGTISSLRISPLINGRPGDEFFIKSVTATSSELWRCTTPTGCDWYPFYTHPCERCGTAGGCRASAPPTGAPIIKGVNDKLAVNINNYGDVNITLSPETTPTNIAKAISIALSSIEVGGYGEADCTWDGAALTITGGIVGSATSVTVKSPDSNSAALDVGFSSSLAVEGSDAASGYMAPPVQRLTAIDIQMLVKGRSDNPLYIDPTSYTVYGGRSDWSSVGQTNTLQGGDKTLIDLCYPIQGQGRLKKAYVCGSLGPGAKLKVFRPLLGNKLDFVADVSFGTQTAPHYSTLLNIFEIDCDIPVWPGDLIGVYDCSPYIDWGPTENIDASYLAYDGDVCSSVSFSSILGNGERGLPIRVDSQQLAQGVWLEADFGHRVSLGQLSVQGIEDIQEDEYNITGGDGVNVSVELNPGSQHQYVWLDSVGTTHTESIADQAFNIQCLTDGVEYPFGGAAPLNSNSEYATYFYINGDGEWASQEIPGATVVGFTYNPFWITFKFIDDPLVKRISKTVIFFKDQQNIKNFSWEYWLGGHTGGDGTSNTWMKIPAYSSVILDQTTYLPGSSDYLFSNPSNCSAQFDANGNMSNFNQWVQGGKLTYTRMEHQFAPVESSRIQLWCGWHLSTKISEIEIYSSSYNQGSISTDTQCEASDDGNNWKSYTSEGDNVQASFAIAYPSQYFNLQISPSSKTKLTSITAESFQSDLSTADYLSAEECKRGGLNAPIPVEFVNNSDIDLDLFIDIPDNTYVEEEILSCSLQSQSDADGPERGTPAQYYIQPDKPLVAQANVLSNCTVFALTSLIQNAWLNSSSITESDCFAGTAFDTNRWNVFNSGSLSVNNSLILNPPMIYNDAQKTNLWLRINGASSLAIGVECVKYENGTFNFVYSNPAGVTFPASTTATLPLSGMRIKRVGTRVFLYYLQNNWNNWEWSGSSSGLSPAVNIDGPVNIEISYDSWSTYLGGPESFSTSSLISTWNATGDFDAEIEFSTTQSVKFVFSGESTMNKTAGAWIDINGNNLPVVNNITSNFPLTNNILLACDLGHNKVIDFYTNHSTAQNAYPLWDMSGVRFSLTDTTDPSIVQWGNADRSNARWMLLTQYACGPNPLSSLVREVGGIGVYPLITSQLESDGAYNTQWTPLGLTDDSGSINISSSDYPVLLFDLGYSENIQGHSLTGWPNNEYAWSFTHNTSNDPRGCAFSTWGGGKCAHFINSLCTYVAPAGERPPYDTTSTIWPPRSTYNRGLCNGYGTEFKCNDFTYGRVRYAAVKNTSMGQTLTAAGLSATPAENPWEHQEWWHPSQGSTVEVDFSSSSPDSGTALKITGGAQLLTDLGQDPYWSGYDSISLDVRSDYPQQIDMDRSCIRMGNSVQSYYEWNLSALGGVGDAWSSLSGDFTTAAATLGTISTGSAFNLLQGLPTAQFASQSVKYLEVNLVPTKGYTEASIEVTNFSIRRVGFGPRGVFLRDGEWVSFYTGKQSLRDGSILFTLLPAWDSSGLCTWVPASSSLGRYLNPNLCRIVFDDGTIYSLTYEDGKFTLRACRPEGIAVASAAVDVTPGTPLDIAFCWSADGTGMVDKSNLKLYIEGKAITSLSGFTWDTNGEGATVILGGEASNRAAGPSATSSYSWFSNLCVLPQCSIEVPEVSTSAARLITISLDGDNYFSAGDPQLPLAIYGVTPNQKTTVWAKCTIPKDLSPDASRLAEVKVQWTRPV